jgi:carbonic anhydrase/acetyltransferase-like protein (isoleucine patch superfamily)
MGSHGFRKPASMIAKITDDEIKKIAKKNNANYEKTKENLLAEGRKLLNGK